MLTRMDNLEWNISELMELKNTTRELHKACTSFNSRIDQAQERISEVEDQLNEIKREGKIREKRVKRNEQSLQEIHDYVKRPNLRLIGVPEYDGENESKLENTLQDIIQENFPNLARQANIQVQTQRTPQRYSARATPRHIIVRFTRVEMKEKMLSVAREKGRVTHKGKPIRLTADFSADTLQARREWGSTFNILKEKNFQLRISYPAKLSFIRHKVDMSIIAIDQRLTPGFEDVETDSGHEKCSADHETGRRNGERQQVCTVGWLVTAGPSEQVTSQLSPEVNTVTEQGRTFQTTAVAEAHATEDHKLVSKLQGNVTGASKAGPGRLRVGEAAQAPALAPVLSAVSGRGSSRQFWGAPRAPRPGRAPPHPATAPSGWGRGQTSPAAPDSVPPALGRGPRARRWRPPGLTSEFELVLRLEAQDLLHLRHVPQRRSTFGGETPERSRGGKR
ncbi:LINE-1 retrotransposable element ORF1 protein [Plecturocebus cupreus]